MRPTGRHPRSELVGLAAVAAVRVVAARRARRRPTAAADPEPTAVAVAPSGPAARTVDHATWAWRSVSAVGVVLVLFGSFAVGTAWSDGPARALPEPDPAAAPRPEDEAASPGEDGRDAQDRRSATAVGSGVPVPPATRGARLELRARSELNPPVSIAAASGSVQAVVTEVGVDELGGVAVPPNADQVGWYRHGPTPGAPGSSVLVGHVDYDGRPGPFYELRDLASGETLMVTYADGSVRGFRVVDRRQFPKGDLAGSGVFDTSADPRLVLVTCGGSFDRSQRSYVDNIAVTAVPV